MKIPVFWRNGRPRGEDPVPRAYRPWLILSLLVLVGSLFLLAVLVVVVFVRFGSTTATPLWLVLLGVLAGLGIALGFGGLLLLMLAAGYSSWRKARQAATPTPAQEP